MKRCLMVTGGPLDLSFGRRFLLGRTYELVIAVDAGLAACEALGLRPDLLVGISIPWEGSVSWNTRNALV